jgi:hypothetical protein
MQIRNPKVKRVLPLTVFPKKLTELKFGIIKFASLAKTLLVTVIAKIKTSTNFFNKKNLFSIVASQLIFVFS